MNPKLFCYTEAQNSTVVKETFARLSEIFPIIKDEKEAILDKSTIIIQFVNTVKPEATIKLIKARRILYPKHLLICIGPSARLELKFELFKSGLDEYLNFYTDLALICQKIYHSYSNFNVVKKPNLLTVGSLSLDPIKRTVERKGRSIRLRTRELDLLTYLMKRNNQVCSTAELLEQVGGYNYQVASNTVQTHMNSLRNKVDKDFKQKLLHTLPKQGYIIAEQSNLVPIRQTAL